MSLHVTTEFIPSLTTVPCISRLGDKIKYPSTLRNRKSSKSSHLHPHEVDLNEKGRVRGESIGEMESDKERISKAESIGEKRSDGLEEGEWSPFLMCHLVF